LISWTLSGSSGEVQGQTTDQVNQDEAEVTQQGHICTFTY